MGEEEPGKPGTSEQTSQDRRRLKIRRESVRVRSDDDAHPTLDRGPEPGKMAPDLEWREVRQGQKPGDSFVRYVRPHGREFKRTASGHLVVSERVLEPRMGFARVVSRAKRTLVGQRLATSALIHERLTKVKALAVFSSDAISSSAYATDEILLVLVLAGTMAFSLTLPIALAITTLLAIVAISYRQTIRAYPQGGGAYIVAKDNLGAGPALVAGASLLIDYVLTVAVSISSGVAAITSAFPALHEDRVLLAVAFIALITIVNLRGVRESGTIFAAPTYLFIGAIFTMIGVGLFKMVTGSPMEVAHGAPAVLLAGAEPLAIFLVLRAFASGCAALTGTEAISDGVPAFKPPEAKNAATTLGWMAGILGVLFLGITFMASRLAVAPSAEETVVSQIGRAVFGTSPAYYLIQAFTMLILVLAANTSFQDFPRLAWFLARDEYLPHAFHFRGDRLAFTVGIIALAGLATLLVVVFRAETHALIPLYAVGVFISFTLSQSSMVRRWWKEREKGWRRGLAINGLGAATTGVVAIVIASTKFLGGAWLVILLVPVLVLMLLGIHRHYRNVAKQLKLGQARASFLRPAGPKTRQQPIIVPVAGLNQTVVQTLDYATSISRNVTAVHVTDDVEEAAKLRKEWDNWEGIVPLVILESPYRSLIPPLVAYIDAIDEQDTELPVTVLLSEFVPKHWWEWLLHNQSAFRLKLALFRRPNTIVIDVPYHLGR